MSIPTSLSTKSSKQDCVDGGRKVRTQERQKRNNQKHIEKFRRRSQQGKNEIERFLTDFVYPLQQQDEDRISEKSGELSSSVVTTPNQTIHSSTDSLFTTESESEHFSKISLSDSDYSDSLLSVDVSETKQKKPSDPHKTLKHINNLCEETVTVNGVCYRCMI